MTSDGSSPRAIGAPVPRYDGVGKATGAAEYTADVKLDGILVGKVLRSPWPHARIARIDVSKAKELPGVHAVLTGDDTFPGARFGRAIVDTPVLAQGVVRFVGEPVAAVAAVDKETALAALELIDVGFQELPAVFTPEAAMAPGAPILHPDMMDYAGMPKPVEAPANMYAQFESVKGDVDAGLAAADMVVENTFTTPRQHQAYMEPHSCLVHIAEDGRVHVWNGNKSPHSGKRFLSIATQVPADQILFHPVTIGGDFGGKGSVLGIPVAHMLAKATGRPIRMVLEYSEDLIAANPRHPSRIHMRTGVMRDGTIVAHDSNVTYDSGAYAGYKPGGHLGGAVAAGGPYKIPNGRMVERQVYTNNVPGGYMRGPGEPQAMFAVESQIDCVARAIGMDPAEIRRKNMVGEGEEDTLGASFQHVRSAETLAAAVQAAGYDTPKPAADGTLRYGRGIGFGERAQIGGETYASVTMNVDGSVVAHTSIFEQGTGTYTVLQQMVADGLGLPVDRVSVQVWDTDGAPNDSGIGGARVTRMMGVAVHEAIENAKAELFKLTAELLGWPDDRLRVEGDSVAREDTGESQSWAGLLARTGEPVVGNGATKDNSHNPFTHFTAQIAEVSVDSETGEVKLLTLTTAHDSSVVLNPMGHTGQINGGVVQGIGYGLQEDLAVEGGRVSTASLADYKILTIADIPELRTALLEPVGGFGPYGIKGVGENSNSQTAPAIANAVEDAVGVRITDLPVTAERVLRALQA